MNRVSGLSISEYLGIEDSLFLSFTDFVGVPGMGSGSGVLPSSLNKKRTSVIEPIGKYWCLIDSGEAKNLFRTTIGKQEVLKQGTCRTPTFVH